MLIISSDDVSTVRSREDINAFIHLNNYVSGHTESINIPSLPVVLHHSAAPLPPTLHTSCFQQTLQRTTKSFKGSSLASSQCSHTSHCSTNLETDFTESWDQCPQRNDLLFQSGPNANENHPRFSSSSLNNNNQLHSWVTWLESTDNLLTLTSGALWGWKKYSRSYPCLWPSTRIWTRMPVTATRIG